MISLRSSRRGCITCLRLKASSWRVRPAARFGGALDLLDVGAARIAGVEAVEDQVGVAEDGREHVVEVVRDAAGEPADRFHLLRLAQLRLAVPQRLLGLPALGQVADPGDEEGAAGRVDARDGELESGSASDPSGSRRARGAGR